MNNYSYNYFGKDLDELTYADISDYFITEQEESDKIEFKAYHAQYGNFNKNFEGVTKGICAFLNSNGGILIWGAPLAKKQNDRIVFQGELSLVMELIEKDSLISKISDSITPLPVNVNVKTIEHNNLYLYIFEIQQSNYSPHQFKNTYWARLDGQTKPAPHYLVEALFRKISFPQIEGYIAFDKFGNYDNTRVYLDITVYILNFSELQNEYDVEFTLICNEAIFEGSFTDTNSWKYYSLGGHKFESGNYIKTLHFGKPESITEKIVFNLDELKEKNNGNIHISLIFGGKNSPLKSSEYKLNFNTNKISQKNPDILEFSAENIFSSEKQRILGTTKENLLKTLLSR